jgi:hypothetical protein
MGGTMRQLLWRLGTTSTHFLALWQQQHGNDSKNKWQLQQWQQQEYMGMMGMERIIKINS